MINQERLQERLQKHEELNELWMLNGNLSMDKELEYLMQRRSVIALENIAISIDALNGNICKLLDAIGKN